MLSFFYEEVISYVSLLRNHFPYTISIVNKSARIFFKQMLLVNASKIKIFFAL